MRPSLLLLGLVLSLASTAPATALAGELRQPVLAALDGVEDPPSAETLTAIGPGVEAELLEIAIDGEVPRTRRARALHSLGWFPSDATRSLLESQLGSGDRLMARKAAYALANGWKADAVPLLQRSLASDDVQLRVASARALASIDSDVARAALQARLSVETNATVQSTIQTALAD